MVPMSGTTTVPLSPENSMVLDEIARAESGSIPRYDENSTPEPPAEPAPNGKVPCDICGKFVKDTYLPGHKLKQHGSGRTRPFKNRATRPDKKSKAVAIPEPASQGDETLTVDGIIGTVVELRWPHTMPTRKALEMLELRAALEKFLT